MCLAVPLALVARGLRAERMGGRLVLQPQLWLMSYRACLGGRDDGSGCTGLASAWLAATTTTPGQAPASAGRRSASGRRTSGTAEPARPEAQPLLRLGLARDRGQPGVGQHGQGDMAVAVRPVPDLVLVQPGLPLCLFETLLRDGPRRGHPRQVPKGDLGRGQGGGEVVGIVGGATGAEGTPPVALLDDPGSSPVVDSWPLLALGGGERLPALGRPAGDHRHHRRGWRGTRGQPHPGPGPAPSVTGGPHHRWALGPDGRGRRDREHVPPTMTLDRLPQRSASPLVPGHPAHRHPMRPGVLQHGNRVLRLGREADPLGDLGPGPAHQVVASGIGYVPAPVQEHVPARGGVGQGISSERVPMGTPKGRRSGRSPPCRPCRSPAAARPPRPPASSGVPHRDASRWGPQEAGLAQDAVPSGSPKASHPKDCRRSRAASTSQSTDRPAAAGGQGWHPPPPRPSASRSCARPGRAGPAGTWPPARRIPTGRTGRRSARKPRLSAPGRLG